MKQETIILLLSVCVVVLMVAIVYLVVYFKRGVISKLKAISRKLEGILDTDSDEKIMIFTDKRVFIDLAMQINRLLEECQMIKADFRCSEIASKKMLSNISHDLKTPLTVILGYLEIMLLHAQGTDFETLKKVQNKAEQVVELVNQFFTLAKLEAGDTVIALSAININEVCRENILDFYNILAKTDFEVAVDIPEKVSLVQGNDDAMQRILFNLLSNAVRYGSDGKYLGLILREDDSFVYIDVIDRGNGIESTFATNVFERLYTMEDSRDREIQGNGLGLTIAKKLALQLGGDITLDSIPFVKTTFTVKLKKVPFFYDERNS